jgi:regulator of protease activity HflC (stomatin/prohibitin superfamily)
VRNVVGRSALDQVLSAERLNQAIRSSWTSPPNGGACWFRLVELTDIELPQTMQRAMARQAEADRETRARIIAAEGEALSAGRPPEAADVIVRHPTRPGAAA